MGENENDVLNVLMGSIVESTREDEFHNGEDTVIMEVGEKAIIGFDGYIHPLQKNILIEIDESIQINGYSATGLANFIVGWLDSNVDLAANLKGGYEFMETVRESVENGLIAIGMTREVVEEIEQDT